MTGLTTSTAEVAYYGNITTCKLGPSKLVLLIITVIFCYYYAGSALFFTAKNKSPNWLGQKFPHTLSVCRSSSVIVARR